MDTITFKTSSDDLTFEVAQATFAIAGALTITLSLRCNRNEEHSWMSRPSFCLVDYPLAQPLRVGTSLTFPAKIAGENANAKCFVYTGEHVDPQSASVTVVQVNHDMLEAEVEWFQADPDFYDERAKPTRVFGRVTFRQGLVSQMWIPS